MSLTDIAAVAGLVSSIAVVLSLIYLSIQIRQNTRHQRASMQQGRAARQVDLLARTGEPGLAPIMLRGRNADPQLTPAELEQYLRLMTALFLNFEDGFLLRRAAMLDDASAASDGEALKNHIFNQPGYRAAWTMLRSGMQPAFRDYMDAIMRETAPLPTGDRHAAWKSLVAEQAAPK
ncbi:MAG: hypothetical protein HY243_10850 [Proteobacteria bacterium]|nr:hypothetical protein [Pseudomonadota bacterium]